MKKLLAAILIALMLLAALPAAAFARAHTGAVSEAYVPGLFEGRGSEDEPFLISSKAELMLLAEAVNGGEPFAGLSFALSRDIDISGMEWTPIGMDCGLPFSGSFRGNGHVISGLTITTGRDYAALFGYSKGDIEGVRIVSASVLGGVRAACVVACGAARNCCAEGSVSGVSCVGGVVGEGSAYDCVSACSVCAESLAGSVIGLGDATGCTAGDGEAISGRGAVREAFGEESGRIAEPMAKRSVAAFIRWALLHVDPESVPANADLLLQSQYCGKQPWKYLYGSIRAALSETTVNYYYLNHYTKYMFPAQYQEATADWSNYTYATDCQGLLDAWLTYDQGESTDINCQMNYAYWCTDKGLVSEIDRAWVVGEAVFIYSDRLGRMGHVGWICGFDEDGEPLVVEAKGFFHGVIVSRLSEGSWTHRGLMTVKFNYDAFLSPSIGAALPAAHTEDCAFTDPDAGGRTPVNVWNGVSASDFAGGSGTASDPYLVSTASQLAYLSLAVRTGNSFYGMHIALTNDIWLNDTTGWESWSYLNNPANSWTPIGVYTNASSSAPFRGSFDGRGHTVYGLYFSTDEKSCMGLFGYVGENSAGVIKNVRVARSFMDGENSVGGIIGYMSDYGRVENCHHSGRIKCATWVGGVVGWAENSAGVTTISSCSNTGYVQGSTDTGGIIGCAHGGVYVTGCTNAGSLVKSFRRTGGIVGMLISSSVERCRMNGPVRGMERTGGIAGHARYSPIKESYSGNSITGCYYVGGISGSTTGGTVENCFSVGAVTGIERAGGLVGFANAGSVRLSYNVGAVTALRLKGCVLGEVSGTTVQNVFALSGCCPGGNSQGVQIAASLFLAQSGYSGFDFTTIWKIDSATAYPFAELRRAAYSSTVIPSVPSVPDPTPSPAPTPTPTPWPTAQPTLIPYTPVPTAPPSVLLGDADGDGVITVSDALLMIRIVMGVADVSSLANGVRSVDMDGDGVLTAADALWVLRAAMGLLN